MTVELLEQHTELFGDVLVLLLEELLLLFGELGLVGEVALHVDESWED